MCRDSAWTCGLWVLVAGTPGAETSGQQVVLPVPTCPGVAIGIRLPLLQGRGRYVDDLYLGLVHLLIQDAQRLEAFRAWRGTRKGVRPLSHSTRG